MRLLLGVRLVELIAGSEAGQKIAAMQGIPAELVVKSCTPARQASLSRKTKETSIELSLALDGNGNQVVASLSSSVTIFSAQGEVIMRQLPLQREPRRSQIRRRRLRELLLRAGAVADAREEIRRPGIP